MGYRSLSNSRGVRNAAKERPPRQDKPKAQYEKNVVYRSPITGEFFFARKVKVLSATDCEVVGDKIDVTRFIAPYLGKGALQTMELLKAARFALSVLKANPIETSERLAIEKLQAAIEEIEKREGES